MFSVAAPATTVGAVVERGNRSRDGGWNCCGDGSRGNGDKTGDIGYVPGIDHTLPIQISRAGILAEIIQGPALIGRLHHVIGTHTP